MAQEVGRVISTQPVLQQTAVPRQVCNTVQVPVQAQKSGAGALVGALAGGAVGNQIGQGAGNAAATIALQVSPVGSQASPPAQQPVYQQPQYPQQVVVTSVVPAYPVVVARHYGPRYYPPISLNFGWSYSEGRHGGGHDRGHWR